jgi:hypothetical protein
VIALKEWSAAIHALLDGRQTVLLRKGGIHEKRFALTANEFLLFPTVAHGHAERVRPEYRPLIDAARADNTDYVVIRAAAKVVGAVEVHNVGRLPELEDLHIWTAASVQADRLDFRPRHRLTVLTVQVYPLASPARVARVPEFAGCKSWVQVPVAADFGAPRYEVAELLGIARRVSDTVG